MFKTIFFMAYKNAFLRRGRAVLLIMMIGVSMAVMVGLEGLYDGMTQHMIDKTMRSDCGDIALFSKHYRIEDEIKYHITQADQKVQKLQNLSGVKEVLWRVESSGLAQTARKSQPARIIGIDLKAEEAFGKFSDFLKKGKLSFGKRGVFVGSELANKLKLHLGTKVIFSMQDAQHQMQSVALYVKAILHTTNVTLDAQGLFIPREKLDSLLALPAHTATQIALRKESDTKTSALKQKIKTLFPTLDVRSFIELYPQLKQMQQLMNVFNEITFFIVMVVIFIGILGVMYVSILERIREFGILRSIGYAYKNIRMQVLTEALFLGFFGYLLGVILGLLFLAYLKYQGLDLSIYAQGMSKFGMDSVIYAVIKPSYFLNTFATIMIASLLSVVLPLEKIKKLNPIEVIRNLG